MCDFCRKYKFSRCRVGVLWGYCIPAAAAGGGAASRPTRPRQRAAPPITHMQQHAAHLTSSNLLSFNTFNLLFVLSTNVLLFPFTPIMRNTRKTYESEAYFDTHAILVSKARYESSERFNWFICTMLLNLHRCVARLILLWICSHKIQINKILQCGHKSKR